MPVIPFYRLLAFAVGVLFISAYRKLFQDENAIFKVNIKIQKIA